MKKPAIFLIMIVGVLALGWQGADLILQDRVTVLETQVSTLQAKDATHESIIGTLVDLYLPTQETFFTSTPQSPTAVPLITPTVALTSTLFVEECWQTKARVFFRTAPHKKGQIQGVIAVNVRLTIMARHYDEQNNLWLQLDYPHDDPKGRRGFVAAYYLGNDLAIFIHKGKC